jgi:hypothetical protein
MTIGWAPQDAMAMTDRVDRVKEAVGLIQRHDSCGGGAQHDAHTEMHARVGADVEWRGAGHRQCPGRARTRAPSATTVSPDP